MRMRDAADGRCRNHRSLVPPRPDIMPLFGSNPVAAVELAIGLLDEVEATRSRILLMTDGINGFLRNSVLPIVCGKRTTSY